MTTVVPGAQAPRLPGAFYRLAAARFFSTFATQMLAVVVGWQVYAQTQSALAMGSVGLAEALPALSLALWAGYQVDHGRPERIFRYVLCLTTLAVAVLFASFQLRLGQHAPGMAGARARAPLAVLYAMSFCTGAARAYYQPCITVLLPWVVRREELPRATALSTSSMQLARVLGPGLGGLIFGWVGPESTLLVVLALMALSLAALWWGGSLLAHGVDTRAPTLAAATGTRLTLLLEGVRYVRGHGILLAALSLDMVCVFFGSVTALLPIFAQQVLAAGPTGLGVLRAAPALGGALASLVLTRIDVRAYAGRAMLLAVFGFGLCTLAFATSRNFALSVAILALSGMLDSVSVLVRQLIVQLMSPANMRGRISAVNAIFVGSSNEIGEFESGLAAEWLGLLPSIYFGGSVCLLVVLAMSLWGHRLRALNLKELSEVPAHA